MIDPPTNPADGSALPVYVIPAGPAEVEAAAEEPNGLFAGPNTAPDRFELLGVGRQGGEGAVWRARYHGHLQQPVEYAVKYLQPPPGHRREHWPAPADERRWQDQVHLLKTVENHHLVRVHDWFLGPPPHPLSTFAPVDDGREYTHPYLVMEWIDGRTLADRIRDDAPPIADRLRWIRDVADGLDAMHSTSRTFGNPVLHRDLKPSNCMVHSKRGAVIVDTGTLRSLSDDEQDGVFSDFYAAPEVLAAPRTAHTPAADVFALGGVAYYCITGHHPPRPQQDGFAALVLKNLVEALADLGAARPVRLAAHLAAALDMDPARRPTQPGAWAHTASALGTPRSSRRRRWLVAAGAAIVLTAGAAVVVAHLPSRSGPPAAVAGFRPFSTEFANYRTRVGTDSLEIAPPTGDDRYDHLWGLFSPGEACATTIEFDVRVDAGTQAFSYGLAVAPRSTLPASGDVQGYSVQYEWEGPDSGLPTAPGSYLRPAQLPGGAWEGTTDPTPAPDITRPHHVMVNAVGAALRMSVDGTTAQYRIPEVECGGITVRAWGAPVALTNIRIGRS
jgi:serine/threonine protein kinase